IHSHLARGSWLSGKVATALNIPLIAKMHNYDDLKYYIHVDRFVTTTLAQERFLLEKRIPTLKITSIPNFSPLQTADAPHILPTDTPVFIALGRFVKKKGMDILLHAFARYLSQGGHAKLRIGGAGRELPRLLRLRQDLNLSQEVEFYGWIDNVREFLNQADIFILPSLDEPFD